MIVDDIVYNVQAIEILLEDYMEKLNIHSFFDSQIALNYF